VARAKFLELCADRWPDKLARLRDGFYTIQDEGGDAIPFRLRPLQEKFLAEQHGFDLLLKARQLGFTTVIQIDYLDDCLFSPNIAAGVIAHNREDAEAFFNNKIRFAYDNLPDEFKDAVPATQDSTRSMQFGNGSSIRVGTSLRSGTFQRLHVSEYGKLCAKFPDKAREVKSGALNTVHVGQKIRIESTAEGQSGHFYDLCKKAQDKMRAGAEMTALDFKFHFFGWYLDDKYQLPSEVYPSREQEEYFEKLAQQGIELTRQQRSWYIKKAEQQDDDMKREFPSTPEEAFAASVEGAYLSRQMAKARSEGRICRIPILDMPVDTSWDLGVNDSTAITFWQTVGLERRAIDYYENSGEGWGHYAKVLNEKGYNYRRHYGPHDLAHRMMGIVAETRQEKAEQAGIKPWDVVKQIPDEMAGIDASRDFLAQVWFDETRCGRLIECMDNYRKEWDDVRGVWKDRARHDEFSHGYKSFETYAVGCPTSPVNNSHATTDKMKRVYAERNKGVV
jgi:hypothetical protein